MGRPAPLNSKGILACVQLPWNWFHYLRWLAQFEIQTLVYLHGLPAHLNSKRTLASIHVSLKLVSLSRATCSFWNSNTSLFSWVTFPFKFQKNFNKHQNKFFQFLLFFAIFYFFFSKIYQRLGQKLGSNNYYGKLQEVIEL